MTSQAHATVAATVGQNVRILRLRLEWTQEELADILKFLGCETNRTTIQRLEAGTAKLNVDLLCGLAMALRTQPHKILVPLVCEDCNGQPPAGFSCNTCQVPAGPLST